MTLALLLSLFTLAAGFAAGVFVARRVAMQTRVPTLDGRHDQDPLSVRPVTVPPSAAERVVLFEEIAPRETRSTVLAEHGDAWKSAMRGVGNRMRDADVAAIVFAHGSFVGTDPLSARSVVEQMLPDGRALAKAIGRRTRTYVDRLLGDLGNFGPDYVRLFEAGIGATIPCTPFVWSSENHHVGRLDGALGLVRLLATHAALAPPRGRLLVLGHSHAGQVFALVTQLLSRSLASEAILDVARARSIDISSLDVDLRSLERAHLDFVTFGSPARYAWGNVARVRSLHVVHGRAAPENARLRLAGDDWVRRLGGAGSDFPALAARERLLNATLDATLGPGFAPAELARSLHLDFAVPPHGELVLVDYGGERLASVLSSGLGHGVYTRLDAMLFHASLVASRLYPAVREARRA